MTNLIKGSAILVLSLTFIATSAFGRERNFTSTTDKNGRQTPATADIHANGTIKCTSAAGSNAGQSPPACFVLGQILPPGQTAGTGQGGTMTLTCNGQAPLRCTIHITD